MGNLLDSPATRGGAEELLALATPTDLMSSATMAIAAAGQSDMAMLGAIDLAAPTDPAMFAPVPLAVAPEPAPAADDP